MSAKRPRRLAEDRQGKAPEQLAVEAEGAAQGSERQSGEMAATSEANPRRSRSQERNTGEPGDRASESDADRFTLSAGSGERPGPRLATPSLLLERPEPPAPRLPPTSELRRFNTTRLLPAKYSESVLTRIAEGDDLQLIFELDNATNDRPLAERNMRPWITPRELVFDVAHSRIINAAFTHPHPQGGRFSMPYRGAWYAAFELATAKSEVLFHRALHFAEIGWQQPEQLDYDQYLADMSGSFHDLRPDAFGPTAAAERPIEEVLPHEGEAGVLHAVAAPVSLAEFAPCLDPRSYVTSQQLAIHLLEAGSLGIIYPSARRKGGTCVACFRPSAVVNVRKRELFRLTWYPDRAATFVRCGRPAPV